MTRLERTVSLRVTVATLSRLAHPELNLTGVSVGRCVVMQPNLTCIFSDEPEVRDASPVEFAPRSSPSSLVRHEERGSCECGLQISRITRTAQLLHFQEPHFALRDVALSQNISRWQRGFPLVRRCH
jgi:hypothetical protein